MLKTFFIFSLQVAMGIPSFLNLLSWEERLGGALPG